MLAQLLVVHSKSADNVYVTRVTDVEERGELIEF
jgi:hypothetical protein